MKIEIEEKLLEDLMRYVYAPKILTFWEREWVAICNGDTRNVLLDRIKNDSEKSRSVYRKVILDE